MDITITLGWWISPVVITIAVVAWMFAPVKQDAYGMDIVGALGVLFGAFVCCLAWMVYFALSLWLD